MYTCDTEAHTRMAATCACIPEKAAAAPHTCSSVNRSKALIVKPVPVSLADSPGSLAPSPVGVGAAVISTSLEQVEAWWPVLFWVVGFLGEIARSIATGSPIVRPRPTRRETNTERQEEAHGEGSTPVGMRGLYRKGPDSRDEPPAEGLPGGGTVSMDCEGLLEGTMETCLSSGSYMGESRRRHRSLPCSQFTVFAEK